MQPRTVVIIALVLAAVLAGTLIYLVNNGSPLAVAPTPSLSVAPSIAPSAEPLFSQLPFPSTLPTPEPRISEEAARIVVSPTPAPEHVQTSAATGTGEWLLTALGLSVISGLFGITYQLKRSDF